VRSLAVHSFDALTPQFTLPRSACAPACHSYRPYATVDPDAGAPDEPWTSGHAVQLLVDEFEPDKLAFTRPRVAGDPARGLPGRGMGATMVAPA